MRKRNGVIGIVLTAGVLLAIGLFWAACSGIEGTLGTPQAQ